MIDAVEAYRDGDTSDCFRPHLLSVFGDFDIGIAFVADDLESVFVVGGHEGVDAQETLRGFLPATLSPIHARALAAVTPPPGADVAGVVALISLKVADVYGSLGWLAPAQVADGICAAWANDAGRGAIAMPGLAWSEVLVVAVAESYQALLALHEALEGEPALNTVRRLPAQVPEAVERMLGVWVGRDRDGRLKPDEFDELGQSHLFSAARLRFALPEQVAFGAEDPTLRAEWKAQFVALREGNPSPPISAPRPTAAGGVVAHCRLRAKPGHLGAACAALSGHLALESFADGSRLELFARVSGRGDVAWFVAVAMTSLWCRTAARDHLLDVTTGFLTAATAPAPLPPRARPPSVARGYDLLHRHFRVDHERVVRNRMLFLGCSEDQVAAAVRFHSHLRAACEAPDLFGALLPVSDFATSIERLLHEPCVDEEAQGDVINSMANYVREGAQSLRQRLQHSSAFEGCVPVQSEVPAAFNQVLAGYDGLVRAAFQPVSALDHGGAAAEAPLVVFTADGAMSLAGGHPRSCGVLRIGMGQVLAGPVALGLVFHELGHRLEFLYRVKEDRPRPASPERDASVIAEDWREIVPDAAWRILGCGDDWEVFAAQFLISAALHLTEQPVPPGGEETHWLRALTRLRLQWALRQEARGESVPYGADRFIPTGFLPVRAKADNAGFDIFFRLRGPAEPSQWVQSCLAKIATLNEAYQGLDARDPWSWISPGASPTDPRGRVGSASPSAFAYIRDRLTSATRASIATFRGSLARKEAPPEAVGWYALPTGRTVHRGAVELERAQRERVDLVVDLAELAARLRVGPILDQFWFRRSIPRDHIELTVGGRTLSADYDGVCIGVRGDTSWMVAENGSLRVEVSGGEARWQDRFEGELKVSRRRDLVRPDAAHELLLTVTEDQQKAIDACRA